MTDDTPMPIPETPADPAAILFDLDGTIVDTVTTRVDAWLQTFREVSIPADRAHVAGLIGSDGRRLAIEVAALSGRHLDELRAEAIDKRAGQLFTELNTAPQPLPGIIDLIGALRASGLPWSIATSSRAEQVHVSLDALQLSERPPVTDGSNVRHAKPAPDLLLLAAEQLGIPARRCWYIGDATWDMLAARAAGMVAIGITTGAVDEPALRRAGATNVYPTVVGLHAELLARGLVPG